MARMIGPVKVYNCDKGTRYTATWQVTLSELPAYTLPYGTDVSQLFGVSPATVAKSMDREAGTDVADSTTPLYYVTIVANGNWKESAPRIPDVNSYGKSYNVKPEYIDPKWFGARLATENEIYKKSTDTPTQNTLRPTVIGSSGKNDANLGDHVYNNWLTDDTNYKGSIKMTQSPILQGNVTDANLAGLLTQEFPKLICTIWWMIATSQIDQFSDFVGVSGTFGNRPELIPVFSVTGGWRVVDQKVEPYVVSGQTWARVTRVMERTSLWLPTYNCMWNPATNGGTWSW